MKLMKTKIAIAAVLLIGVAASQARSCEGLDIRIGPIGICIGKGS